jgi:hypothetical protein
MAILLAVLALIIALVAMFQARGVQRSVRARDRTIDQLRESVARLQLASTQTQARVPHSITPYGGEDAKREAPVSTEHRAIDSAPVSPLTDVSVVEPASDLRAEVVVEHDAAPVEVAPPYSVERVQALYQLWCTDRKRPRPTENMEIASLQYDGQLESSEGRSRHRLKDASQLAEFVRFSEPGSSDGVVLPDPEAHFTPVVAYLFPGLTRADYAQAAHLSSQAPVRIKRATPSQWEVV